MTIKQELPPDVEQSLLLQAQAKGVSLHQFVELLVEEQARQTADKSAAPTPRAESLHDFLLRSPLRGANLDLERVKDYPRSVELA